jgi:hypothetical protein
VFNMRDASAGVFANEITLLCGGAAGHVFEGPLSKRFLTTDTPKPGHILAYATAIVAGVYHYVQTSRDAGSIFRAIRPARRW